MTQAEVLTRDQAAQELSAAKGWLRNELDAARAQRQAISFLTWLWPTPLSRWVVRRHEILEARMQEFEEWERQRTQCSQPSASATTAAVFDIAMMTPVGNERARVFLRHVAEVRAGMILDIAKAQKKLEDSMQEARKSASDGLVRLRDDLVESANVIVEKAVKATRKARGRVLAEGKKLGIEFPPEGGSLAVAK